MSQPDDHFLIASLAGGDEAALRKLVDRYDRLVRYMLFRASGKRCVHDPAWLDALAWAAWAGFVQSVRRDPDLRPASLSAYLVRIARNQVASALRAGRSEPVVANIDAGDERGQIADSLETPDEVAARLELLERLRECFETLGADDRTLVSQLSAIMERRWQAAATALGMAESTLRSRWKQTLHRLRECMEGKTGKIFAPGEGIGD